MMRVLRGCGVCLHVCDACLCVSVSGVSYVYMNRYCVCVRVCVVCVKKYIYINIYIVCVCVCT